MNAYGRPCIPDLRTIYGEAAGRVDGAWHQASGVGRRALRPWRWQSRLRDASVKPCSPDAQRRMRLAVKTASEKPDWIRSAPFAPMGARASVIGLQAQLMWPRRGLPLCVALQGLADWLSLASPPS